MKDASTGLISSRSGGPIGAKSVRILSLALKSTARYAARRMQASRKSADYTAVKIERSYTFGSLLRFIFCRNRTALLRHPVLAILYN